MEHYRKKYLINSLSTAKTEDAIWIATRPGALTGEEITAWMNMVTARIGDNRISLDRHSIEMWAKKWNLSEMAARMFAPLLEGVRVAINSVSLDSISFATAVERRRQVDDLWKVLKTDPEIKNVKNKSKYMNLDKAIGIIRCSLPGPCECGNPHYKCHFTPDEVQLAAERILQELEKYRVEERKMS